MILFLLVHILPLSFSLCFPHDWNAQCCSASVHFWKSVQVFWSAEVKQPQILFFNMHVITSKLVTNNHHTQYINMKSKSRCFCLSFTGKVLSPSTCLTNINQDLSLSIYVFLSKRNEPSGSVESIVYQYLLNRIHKSQTKSRRYTFSGLQWDWYAAYYVTHYCFRKLEVATQESGSRWDHRKIVFWKEIARWSKKLCITIENIPSICGRVKLEVN